MHAIHGNAKAIVLTTISFKHDFYVGRWELACRLSPRDSTPWKAPWWVSLCNYCCGRNQWLLPVSLCSTWWGSELPCYEDTEAARWRAHKERNEGRTSNKHMSENTWDSHLWVTLSRTSQLSCFWIPHPQRWFGTKKYLLFEAAKLWGC